MSRVLTLPAGATTASPSGQGLPVVAALVLLAGGTVWLGADYGLRHAALLPLGAALGLTLYHAAFGFTAAFRALVSHGDARGLRAQMLMLAVATVLFAPVLSAGQLFGCPIGGAFAPASLAVPIGAFVFAIGMQLAGGCGSGCLYHLGAGTMSMAIALAAFIVGSMIATLHMTVWADMPSLGVVTLGESLGWPRAVALQLAIFAAIAAGCWWLERRRAASRPASITSAGWRRIVSGPWPLWVGAVMLALFNVLTLLLAGHPWTITWAFSLWGAKALAATGYDIARIPFWSGDFQQAAVAAPVLMDTTSVMDIGLVLGALLGAGLAGRFAPKRRIDARRAAAAIAGGLLLGYGARVAFGCNIGAYFSGIASTSLHGWLWGAAALLGTPVGIWLRDHVDPIRR